MSVSQSESPQTGNRAVVHDTTVSCGYAIYDNRLREGIDEIQTANRGCNCYFNPTGNVFNFLAGAGITFAGPTLDPMIYIDNDDA